MATAKRKSKIITNKEDIDYLINLSYNEVLKTSFIMKMFGNFKGKQKYNPYDIVTLPAGCYKLGNSLNKKPFTTTVGLWVFNKCFIEEELSQLLGYINTPMTKKMFSKVNDTISYAILEDDLDISVLKKYIKKCQKYQPYVHILTPNHTMAMLLIVDSIKSKKAELLKKYDSRIKSGDEKIVDEIQEQLLSYAKDILQDDPSLDMYNSGAKGTWDNNFKNLFVMRGAIKDPDPTKGYNIITSSYMEGISKEEYSKFANSLAAGPYARGKKTEVGGYWEKLFFAALQHLKALPEGSDCGTKKYITITLTDDVIKSNMYNYIIEGNRLIELNSKNMNSYKGKTVKMRFSSVCESKNGFCNKCLGNLFYKLNVVNVGAATPQLAAKLKLTSMKSFHDASIRLRTLDVKKAFGY